ncbi:MAG TPA: outer membrane lipoprotein-sorting protein [Polyangiaceae bacterium]|jgi:hypothetical protein|nr:outer membrane lipoprotein-sorting protein [Polyangiaceae bacterium]
MNRSKWLLSCLALVALIAVPGSVRADELTGDELAARVVKGNGFTWEGATTRLRMVLIDQGGQRSERALEVLGRRHDGMLESVARFTSPSDIAGTKFLMIEKAGGGTEQHIYLPGLKRTRRVVGREQEGSFMGSDFTYNDLQRKEDKNAKNARLADENIGSEPTYVLESKAGATNTTYAKIKTWIRKKDFIPLRTQFFDADGKLAKTLYVRRTQDIDGKPAVVEAYMKSASGHATELVVDSVKPSKDLPDAAFSPLTLDR